MKLKQPKVNSVARIILFIMHTHTKAVCTLENGQVFLLAKYKIVTLWSENEKIWKFRSKKEKMKPMKKKSGVDSLLFLVSVFCIYVSLL